MKLSLEKRRSLFNELTNSKAFSKATTTTSLLKYLFDATENNINLKESVIDYEFFGEEQLVEKSNSKVRVNVYNLRKKLTNYYENEGKDSEYRLIIEKGQYKVKFVKHAKKAALLKLLNIPKQVLSILLITTVALIIFTYWPRDKPVIWKNFFNKKISTTLFIGDFFGFSGKTITGNPGWSRDYKINSTKEFYSMVDSLPELNKFHRPANYSYTTGMAPVATQKLQELFQTHKHEFTIRFSTKSSISEIKSGNSIYVGPIRNNNSFIHFFNEGNPYFNLSRTKLEFFGHSKLKDTTFNLSSSGLNKEYAIVSKIPGPDNTTQFIFFSNHDMGVESTIQYFTNEEKIKQFASIHIKENKSFTSIFLVSGKDRTNTSLTEILTVDF